MPDPVQDPQSAWLASITPEMKEAIKKAGLPLMSVLMARQLANQPNNQSQGQ